MEKSNAQTIVSLLWWTLYDGPRFSAELNCGSLSPNAVKKAEALVKSKKVDGNAFLDLYVEMPALVRNQSVQHGRLSAHSRRPDGLLVGEALGPVMSFRLVGRVGDGSGHDRRS